MENEVVLRIYLDQNKWVDLARAATGHRKGAGFIDALVMCRAAVAAGAASFPLDMYRYWETSKRGDDRSRNDVADTMLELSHQHTMAVPFGILDQEIDLALQRRFGRPTNPRREQVFGVGMHHIGAGRLSWPNIDLNCLPDGASVLNGLHAQIQTAVNEVIEEGLLRAGPDTLRTNGLDPASVDHGTRFMKWENLVADKIRQQGYNGNHIDMAMRASDLGDIRPAIHAALKRIAMDWEEFLTRVGATGVLEFMDDLPTRYVTNVMRAAKHRQSEQPWEPNDFVDIIALPVAAVYCDVVVTEKQWVHRLRQGKVDKRYATRLLSNTADLVEVLVNATFN